VHCCKDIDILRTANIHNFNTSQRSTLWRLGLGRKGLLLLQSCSVRAIGPNVTKLYPLTANAIIEYYSISILRCKYHCVEKRYLCVDSVRVTSVWSWWRRDAITWAGTTCFTSREKWTLITVATVVSVCILGRIDFCFSSRVVNSCRQTTHADISCDPRGLPGCTGPVNSAELTRVHVSFFLPTVAYALTAIALTRMDQKPRVSTNLLTLTSSKTEFLSHYWSQKATF